MYMTYETEGEREDGDAQELSTHLNFNPPNRTQVTKEVQHKVAHVLDLDAGALTRDLCRGVEEARGRVLCVDCRL